MMLTHRVHDEVTVSTAVDITDVVASLNVAMVDNVDHEHRRAMHSTSAESIQIIASAHVVELLVFSPDSDLLATVEINKDEATRLVQLPVTMKHHFRAVQAAGGRVTIEPAEAVD